MLGSTAAVAATTDQIVLTNGTPIEDTSEGNLNEAVTVAHFTDTGNLPRCDTGTRYTATIDWGDGTTPAAGTLSCTVVVTTVGETQVSTATYTVRGSHTYDDSGNYKIKLTAKDTEDDLTVTAQTDTASITDVALHSTDEGLSTLTGVEGQSLKVAAHFNDNNNSFPDSALTATISWGDGSSSAGVVAECDCSSDYEVTGSHVYDAPTTAGQRYTVKVTLQDDGGQSASDSGSASVTDASLTAGAVKTLTVANGAVASQVVGSFTDAAAAQTAAGDYTATINWGDNTTSSGSVTKTAAGAFSVNGSHTYATGGQKAITATVKDEEGSTVTLTASATVPVLAQTGRPGGSSSPWLPLLLLLVGAATAGLGAGLRIAGRMR